MAASVGILSACFEPRHDPRGSSVFAVAPNLNGSDTVRSHEVDDMALMVGISGIRGIVGETLTPAVALEFAQAFGTLLGGGRVVLARDSRPSGEMFESAAAAGLIAAGVEVTRLGMVMTPAVGRAIRDGRYDGGVMITASHNPEEWNGIKFLDERGMAPDGERARAIAALRNERRFESRPTEFLPLRDDAEAGARHMAAVLDAVEADTAPLSGLRVLLDSVNGAGCVHGKQFLAALGCDVVHLNGEPTGRFAHPPEPIEENLADVCKAVREAGAALGFVQDPDADRLAIIDEHGRFLGEEYTLALSTRSVLSRRPGPVAANLSTSRMIDDIAAGCGAPVFRTPVGEAHVARAILENDCVIGGEGNGGVIDPRISPVRDSLTAMSQVLQLVAASGASVSQLVTELPRYTMIKQKFTCPRERIATAVDAIAEAFAGERIDRSDGVRVDLAEGWIHARASNTEPIMRIIAEAPDEATARELIARTRAIAGL